MEDIKNKDYPAPSGKGGMEKLNQTTAQETPSHVSATNTTEDFKPKAKKPGKLGAY